MKTPESFKLGNNYLFLHHYVPNILATALHAERTRLATLIQTCYRRHAQRNKYLGVITVVRQTKAQRLAAIAIQTRARTALQRKKFLAEVARINRLELERKSATALQAAARAAIQRRKYLAELAAIKYAKEVKQAIKIQSVLRMHQVHKERTIEKGRAAATKLQSIWRTVPAKRELVVLKNASVAIQAAARMLLAKKERARLLARLL